MHVLSKLNRQGDDSQGATQLTTPNGALPSLHFLDPHECTSGCPEIAVGLVKRGMVPIVWDRVRSEVIGVLRYLVHLVKRSRGSREIE